MSISSIPAKLQAESSRHNEDASGLSCLIRRELSDLKSVNLWRGAIAEFVGVALLVMFTVGVGMSREGQEGPPLLQVAIGCGFFLAVIITALSNVSGGHVNPAISIGFLLRGQLTFVRFLIYSIFQTAGAIAGAGLLSKIIPDEFVGNLGLISPNPDVTNLQALGTEITITFLLLFITMAITDPGRKDIGGSIPMIVGLTVAVNILYGANFSGGCMNPVRNFGPAVILGKYDKIWIYWAGPMAGAAIGSIMYDVLFAVQPIGIRGMCRPDVRNNEADVKRNEYSPNENNGNAMDSLLHHHLDESPESKI